MEAQVSSEKPEITLKEFLELAELNQYYGVIKDVLKVTKISQLKYVANTDLHQIGLSKPEVRRYRKIYGKLFPNPYMTKIKKLLIPKAKSESARKSKAGSSNESEAFSETNVPTKHIISIEDITINKELGMGQFGVVQQGTWNTGQQRLQVAIKCLGNERMTSNSTEFLKEAAVMHSIEHPNVVRLYGVVLHLDNLMLVTELAPLRSLLECLREVSLRSSFPVATLCDFAEQICDGMTYLEQKRLIHRDLAARNILVFTKDKVKISDFGLSRALGVGKDYYRTNYNVNLKLPVAWCAPECILYLRFTSASDVWAFGVCLWEMFTYGFQPWAAFSGQQILEAIDAPNCQRLERPECCPASYYTLMSHCWEHDAIARPKFKELSQLLRKLRPEQVQTTANYDKYEDGRRGNFLEYKTGQIITVLNKEYINTGLWYGVLPGGTCGLFDPNNTKPYYRPQPFTKLSNNEPSAISSLPSRSSARSCRSTRPLLSRYDFKRHTYQGKRSIQRSMISSPQGDVKHTGHVGLDGAHFGDISFLDPAWPSQQMASPYRPADDMAVPLLNSPSHTKAGRCKPPYPPNLNPDFLEVYLPYRGPLPMRTAYMKEVDSEEGEDDDISLDENLRTFRKFKNLDPTTSRSIINKVKSATLRRSRSQEATLENEMQPCMHVYHEISDTDTESPSNDTKINGRRNNPDRAENAPVQKRNTHFSKSILKEVDSVFLSYVNRGLERHGRHAVAEPAVRLQALGKFDKKQVDKKEAKADETEHMSVKPMSAHDTKTLDTAVALANEITSKSMTDLELKPTKSPSEKSKHLLNFKFANVSLHSGHDHDKDGAGKPERRNFSEEARNVPDIQATLSEESKQAYTSLIEQPTPSATLRTHMEERGSPKPALLPKSTTMPMPQRPCRPKLQRYRSLDEIKSADEDGKPEEKFKPDEELKRGEKYADDKVDKKPVNILPLPPRGSKPMLVDKPRHFRRHPLKMPEEDGSGPSSSSKEQIPRGKLPVKPNIYQNARDISVPRPPKRTIQKRPEGGDHREDPWAPVIKPIPGPSSTKPKKRNDNAKPSTSYHNDTPEEGSLVTGDHVSVEDLLEFANQKPCGRQRGLESDEVRIMGKVLKQEADPSLCLRALEMSDWDVHQAIKILKVKLSVGNSMNMSLDECARQLAYNSGDVLKATTLLVLCKPSNGQ